jgi:hypothetical protein
LTYCVSDVSGLEFVSRRLVPGGVDVCAETQDPVDVAQDEPALEDKLARETEGKLAGERKERW